MEPRLGLARRALLPEQEDEEPRSLALAGQEHHAPAPLTPGRQVRPTQPLSPLTWTGSGWGRSSGWGLRAKEPVMWARRLERGTARPPDLATLRPDPQPPCPQGTATSVLGCGHW